MDWLWDTLIYWVLVNCFVVAVFGDSLNIKSLSWKEPFFLIQLIVILLVIGYFAVMFIWWYIGSS